MVDLRSKRVIMKTPIAATDFVGVEQSFAHNQRDISSRSVQKANELLKQRKIDLLLAATPLCDARTKRCWERLIRLQAAIFELDYYGEENWEIDEAKLDAYWAHIEVAALALAPKHVTLIELEALRTYQEIEIATRSGEPVSTTPIEVFYEIKSCDIRLLRKCLAAQHSRMDRWSDSAALTVLDGIHEIRDDVEDLLEDVLTFNGNRLISSVVTHGTIRAINEYREFLDRVLENALVRAEFSSAKCSEDLATWRDIVDTSQQLMKCFQDSTIRNALHRIERHIPNRFKTLTAA